MKEGMRNLHRRTFVVTGVAIMVVTGIMALWPAGERQALEQPSDEIMQTSSEPKPSENTPAPPPISDMPAVLQQQGDHRSGTKGSVDDPQVVIDPPSLRSYRREVQANPHQPPSSFVRFALATAVEMRAARRDWGRAETLFAQFSKLLLQNDENDLPEAALAACLSQAKILSVHHPLLDGHYQDLERAVSPRVRELAAPLPTTYQADHP